MKTFRIIVLSCFVVCSCHDIRIKAHTSISTPNLTSLIYLGKDAKKQIPYLVSIQYEDFLGRWKHMCGGSIIHSNYVLTAAHCLLPEFDDYGKSSFRVVAGRNNLRSKKIGTLHRIVSYKPHHKYDDYNGYDIGLIKVRPKFNFNKKTIAKINFDSSERVLKNVPVIFHGWGVTHYGMPKKLQEAYFKTLSDKSCKSKGYDDLSSRDICVIGIDKSVPDFGDSGGPLVNEEKALQIGICAYGMNNYKSPTVFTRVSSFTKWIKDEIGI